MRGQNELPRHSNAGVFFDSSRTQTFGGPERTPKAQNPQYIESGLDLQGCAAADLQPEKLALHRKLLLDQTYLVANLSDLRANDVQESFL